MEGHQLTRELALHRSQAKVNATYSCGHLNLFSFCLHLHFLPKALRHCRHRRHVRKHCHRRHSFRSEWKRGTRSVLLANGRFVAVCPYARKSVVLNGCETLQSTAKLCKALQSSAKLCKALQSSAKLCKAIRQQSAWVHGGRRHHCVRLVRIPCWLCTIWDSQGRQKGKNFKDGAIVRST